MAGTEKKRERKVVDDETRKKSLWHFYKKDLLSDRETEGISRMAMP